jgi:C4-dicarboxylate-specific signal transduction histidine kinase
MDKQLHALNQPLTAICSYSAAAKITLLKWQSSPLSLSEQEISKVIGWLDQISEQAKIASQLARTGESKPG